MTKKLMKKMLEFLVKLMTIIKSLLPKLLTLSLKISRTLMMIRWSLKKLMLKKLKID